MHRDLMHALHLEECQQVQDAENVLQGAFVEWLGWDLGDSRGCWADQLSDVEGGGCDLHAVDGDGLPPPEDDLHEKVEIDADDNLDSSNFYNHYDENTGLELSPHLVKKGRAKEIDKLKKREVYDVVPRDQAKNGK